METLTFQCGHCNRLMAVGGGFLGKEVRCPHCQQVVVAPTQPAPTSPLPDWVGDVDPLAANPPAESPFAVAPDAPTGTKPAATATEPPPEPVAPPPVPDDPFGHLNDPQAALGPPPPAPSFSAFEAAVDDLTPAAPAAVLDLPALEAAPRASNIPQMDAAPPPDVTAPWAADKSESADSAVGAPRPRRPGTGLVMFISLVFLPLLLYAVLVTILAVQFYRQRGTVAPDPRLLLPDEKGDHPGVERLRESMYTDPLPRSLCVALGQTLNVGDLEIQPLRVEARKVRVRVGGNKPEEALYPSLVLHLRLHNTSPQVSFYPLDAYFNRQWSKGMGAKPLTAVEAGSARYYGGSARWGGRDRESVEGDNLDTPLRPGEVGEFFICTNGYEDDAGKLLKYTGPLLWRVQLRRGPVRYQDKDLSATAVVGVEFTDKDVRHF
jgi:hypothetical protein